MNRSKFLVVFLTPSLLSATLASLCAVLVVGAAAWAAITEHQLLPAFLPVDGTIPTLRTALFNSMATYQLLLVVCALGVGVGVYVLIRSVSGLAHESSEALDELHSTNPVVHGTLRATLTRLVVRLVSGLGWIVYALLFLRVLVPFCVALTHQGVAEFDGSVATAVLQIVGALAIAGFATHVHVIFMRLCFMRLRMFGGIDSEIYTSSQQ